MMLMWCLLILETTLAVPVIAQHGAAVYGQPANHQGVSFVIQAPPVGVQTIGQHGADVRHRPANYQGVSYVIQAPTTARNELKFTPRQLNRRTSGNETTDHEKSSANGTHPGPSDGVVIVVAVVSSAIHFERRLAIRSTWGSIGHRHDVRLAFVVAVSPNEDARPWVALEASLHGDLWLGDFPDTYINLTLKSLLILERAQRDHPAARIVVKVDDDCFLNPYSLFTFAREMAENERDGRFIYGRLYPSIRANRQPDEKHYVSFEQYADETFPLFVGGASYVMTRSAVTALHLEASRLVDRGKPFPLEDVFVTGICADNVRAVRLHRLQLEYDRPYYPGMDLSDQMVIHGLSPGDMFHCWMTLHDDVDIRMVDAWGVD